MLSALKKLAMNDITKMTKKQARYLITFNEYLFEIVIKTVENQTKNVSS
ncbi:hypothetical protein GCM10011508_06170 [Flavobacterium lutivivi]|nr:hypothetical protein GCM10011508_06170 [Flavobacterium lutivivi]